MTPTDTDDRLPMDAADPVEGSQPRGVVAWLARCVAHESTAQDLVNIRRWGAWMVAWALLSFVDANWFGAEEGVTSTVTVGLNALVLVTLAGTVLAYARYVGQTDELNRSIQLRAFGVGFAAGFFSIQVAEGAMSAGLVASVDPDVAALVMLLSWAVASVVLQRRYR